jgi:hypothetical protein
MKNLGRVLLLVGVLVLALLIGILVGRGQRAEPTSEGNAEAVQITTAAPPAPTPEPLPAPVKQPQVVSVPKIAPDMQVQEDAAAVGMTTRDGDGASTDDAAPAATPKSAGAASSSEPIG